MKVIRSVVGMKRLAAGWHSAGKTIAFVPTMGALHEGHLSLLRAARKSADKVVASIFVNPIQFGPKEDFRKYPRTFHDDARLLTREGADALFCPRVSDMYPEGFCTVVHVTGLSDRLCGRFRSGHFEGVATIVAKLFSIVSPDIAFFGQKDYQQGKVIGRMVRDLNMELKIRTMPIVREKDGLAMSSRNRYLSAEQRRLAARIFAVLRGVKLAVRRGQRNARVLQSQAREGLKRRGISTIDYVQIVHGETLAPIKKVHAPAVLAVAVRIGSTRLIDNMVLAR